MNPTIQKIIQLKLAIITHVEKLAFLPVLGMDRQCVLEFRHGKIIGLARHHCTVC